jgi:hypothetical protein
MRLLAILGLATFAIGCDAASTLTSPDEKAETLDSPAADLVFPSSYCTLATADVTLYGQYYASDVLAESPNANSGLSWCQDFWVVDVINPYIPSKGPYWIVGSSNYKPNTATTCNALKITVRTWGRSVSGPWVHHFDYVSRGSWNGWQCIHVGIPSFPPRIDDGSFYAVRSAVKVTGLLGNKMKAVGGVVRAH